MRTLLFLAPLCLACGEDDRALPSSGGSASSNGVGGCPPGFTRLDGGELVQGEWSADEIEAFNEGTVVPEGPASVAPFCIADYPFPGESGAAWPLDGLADAQMGPLTMHLATFQLRLCSVAELIHASAGSENWRYPYDQTDWSEGVCDVTDATPDPLGSYGGCESPFGLRDFQVRSSWATMDEDTWATIADTFDPERMAIDDTTFVVWGGTARVNTYYAPNNFGVHDHGSDEGVYVDDGLRLCAEPYADSAAVTAGADAADDWRAWVAEFRDAGTYEAFFPLPEGAGGPPMSHR